LSIAYNYLHHGPPAFLWQRAIAVIVGWFPARTWKNKNKWYTYHILLCNFNCVCVLYKCGRGPHNRACWEAVWRSMIYLVLYWLVDSSSAGQIIFRVYGTLRFIAVLKQVGHW